MQYYLICSASLLSSIRGHLENAGARPDVEDSRNLSTIRFANTPDQQCCMSPTCQGRSQRATVVPCAYRNSQKASERFEDNHLAYKSEQQDVILHSLLRQLRADCCELRRPFWVAVEDLELDYHSMGIVNSK